MHWYGVGRLPELASHCRNIHRGRRSALGVRSTVPMLKSVLLVGASAVALAAIAAPARADNITTNQWYNGFLTTNGTSLIAGSGAGGTNGPILPGGVANASAAPTTGGILS